MLAMKTSKQSRMKTNQSEKEESVEKRGAPRVSVQELELKQPQDPEKGTQEAPPDPVEETREAPLDPEEIQGTPSDPEEEILEAPSDTEGKTLEVPPDPDEETQWAPLDPEQTQEGAAESREEATGGAIGSRGGDKGCSKTCSRVDGFGRTGRTCASKAHYQRQSFAKWCHLARGVDGCAQLWKEQLYKVFCRPSKKSTRKATRRVCRYATAVAR